MDSDKPNKKQKVVKKYNLQEADDLFGTLLSDEGTENDDDLFGLDDGLYDDTFTDIALGDDQDFAGGDQQIEDDAPLFEDTYSDLATGEEEALETEEEQREPDALLHEEPISGEEQEEEQGAEEIEPAPAKPAVTAALIEYVGGSRQEVALAKLFEPQENTVLLIDEETNDGAIVSFDQVSCIRVASLPARISVKNREAATEETIETADGNTYHEFVAPEQDLGNLLLCLSGDEQTPYPFALFPRSNIKKRTQERPLTDILLEKRFISRIMLTRALQEYEQVKGMTLEKIIAQKARIPLAEIEEALNQAQQGPLQGMQKEEILLISGFANEEEIFAALEELENIKKLTIEQFLVEKGIVKETEVYSALADKHRIPFVDLTGRKFSKTTLTALPQSMIAQHEILPLALKDETLLVASHYTDMTHLSADIVKTAGCKYVLFVLSPPSQLRKIIKMLFNKRRQ